MFKLMFIGMLLLGCGCSDVEGMSNSETGTQRKIITHINSERVGREKMTIFEFDRKRCVSVRDAGVYCYNRPF